MTAVADVMTRGVRSMRPDDNLVQAAQAMEELNVGAVPVCEGIFHGAESLRAKSLT